MPTSFKSISVRSLGIALLCKVSQHFTNTHILQTLLGWPVKQVGVWPNSHTTAHHLGPPQAGGRPRPVKKSKVRWSLCSTHPILSPPLLRGLSPGEHIHKSVPPAHQTAGPGTQCLVAYYCFLPFSLFSGLTVTLLVMYVTYRILVALGIQIPAYLSSKHTVCMRMLYFKEQPNVDKTELSLISSFHFHLQNR